MTKSLAALTAAAAVLPLALISGTTSSPGGSQVASPGGPAVRAQAAASEDLVEEYCVRCHNERRLLGN
ncbi:MAG: hypothetical protein F4187_04575, partial [Gemmatimonadetes bacterium]|nr:hypothetical protein [Gemmatimonadota bacterium]